MLANLNRCGCYELLLSARYSFFLHLKRSTGDSTGQDVNKLLAEMTVQKRNLNKSFLTDFPSYVCFTVLGNGSLPNPRSLLLRYGAHKYLFNCGEGTQRAAETLRIRLTGMYHIFVNHSSWNNISGLPGLLLALNTHVTAHGPLSYEGLAEISRTFDDRNEIQFSVNNDCENGFEDSCIKIDFIPIHRKGFCGDSGSGDWRRSHLDIAFVFVGKIRERSGEFSMKICSDLKVPSEPLLEKLKAGEDITLEDGTLIKAEDVREPTSPGRTFMIVDCPSMDYFESMVTNEKLCKLFQPSLEFPLEFIFHFSPIDVVKEDKFQEWMSKFPKTVSHIGLNEYNSSLCFAGANIMSQRLRLLDDQIFIAPQIETECDPRMAEINMLPAPTGLKLNIHPSSDSKLTYIDVEALEASISLKAILEGIESSVGNMADLEEQIKKYKQESKLLPPAELDNGPAIIFLGTGSATPGKYRTASSIIIETAEDNLIMMDCGEATFGQFYRFYGPNYKEKLKNLNLIFITHYHADHQLGLMKLLQQRHKFNPEPVFVICPLAIRQLLHNFDELAGKVTNCCHIRLSQTYMNGGADPKLLEKLNLSELKTVRVQHCRDSFGIVLTTTGDKPKKIVYSGDAMPTKELVNQGEKCDLLIHEATFEDALKVEAILKRHSTFSEAVGMGKAMEAGFTLLTHFSQRYYKSPRLPEGIDENVGLAFDNMRVKFSDLPRLAKMKPALELLFEDNTTRSQSNVYNRKLVEQLIISSDPSLAIPNIPEVQ